LHNFLYTFFIALTNNLDNIGVRIAYSVRGITITPLINLWVSVITFVISFLSAFSGSILSEYLSRQLCSIVAMMLLTSIGLWMIWETYQNKNNDPIQAEDQGNKKNVIHILMNPLHADMDNSKHIDFKEATLLGIGLSVNNVGGALSAGMIGLNSFWVGLLSALLSYIALWAGNYIAALFIKWRITHRAAFAGGFVLIAIGIDQLLK
jgi:putative sporulation protein YtaF